MGLIPSRSDPYLTRPEAEIMNLKVASKKSPNSCDGNSESASAELGSSFDVALSGATTSGGKVPPRVRATNLANTGW